MIRTIFFSACLMGLAACDGLPGKPNPANKWKPASEIADFSTLYRQNCLGCHGNAQNVAGSIGFDNPTYLSVVPREVLLNVISNGIPGTAMPGFSPAAGGSLTSDQIKILVDGILANKPATSAGNLPPYAAALGDTARGAEVFASSCASCHGEKGTGGEKAGSVVDPAYLSLVSTQYLRTIVIAGRPELGCPDFVTRTPGKPMSTEDIADVTAWLVSQRKNEFGAPLIPAVPPQP